MTCAVFCPNCTYLSISKYSVVCMIFLIKKNSTLIRKIIKKMDFMYVNICRFKLDNMTAETDDKIKF